VTYVIVATWRAREGEDDQVARILEAITPLCRAEPGCRFYQAHHSVEDPRDFLIYEQYDDEAAFDAHTRSEHFRQHVLGDAVPRLEARERAVYTTMD
jgi:quinol monooxygenase YgiN